MKLKDALKHYTDTIIYQIIHQSCNSYETTQSRALTEAYFVYPWRHVAGCVSLEGISITSFNFSALFLTVVCTNSQLVYPIN